MTLSKIDNPNQDNFTWRTVIDAGIDQINTNTPAIATNATNITSNDTDIATNATNIATNVTNIATNATNITSNDTDIATNVTNIATNATNIASNDTDIATNVTNIATNATNIATNATNIASNDTDIATNVTNIATNTSDINTHILKNGVTITITATGNSSSVSAVVSGGITGTYTGTSAVQDAIDSIPENLNGNNVAIVVGDDGTGSGQEILVINTINVSNFYGGVVTIKSAKTNDNDGTTAATTVRHNTISTTNADNSISALFSISNNSEVRIQGLNLKQIFSTETSSQVINFSGQSLYTLEHCHISMGNTDVNKGTRGVLSWRSSRGFIESVYFDNCRTMIFSHRNSSVDIVSAAWVGTGTQPIYGVSASGGIVLMPNTDQAQPVGTVATNLVSSGGLITNKNGLILDENVLTATKTVNFDSSMSVTTMQDLIDEQPRNLNGYGLTFQFADGIYDFGTTRLTFPSFLNGTLDINGNANNSGTGTYGVIIQSQGTGGQAAIRVQQSDRFHVSRIEFQATGSGASNYLLYILRSVGVVSHCKFTKTGGTNVRGLFVTDNCLTRATDCNFSTVDYAIFAEQNSNVSVESCNDYGTQPVTGVSSVIGSIVKPIYTDIHGSLANYGTSSGGLITAKTGLILDETILTATKTVNLDNSMSVTEIQNIINDQPKQLNGNLLIFQFANGDYDFIAGGISFNGFDGGYLEVRGNVNNTDVENLSVKFKGEQGSNNGLAIFLNCSARCHIQHIAFEQDSISVTDQRSLRFISVAHGLVNSCSFNSLSTNRANEGIFVSDGKTRINNCKFNNLEKAIYSSQNSTHSYNNSEFSGGTAPDSGLVGIDGAIITQHGTQINAHTNDTSKAGGAVIFNSSGALI